MTSLAVAALPPRSYSAFEGTCRIAAGPLGPVAAAAAAALRRGADAPVLVFDDATGHIVEIDPRGFDAGHAVPEAARLAPGDAAAPQGGTVSAAEPTPLGRGRPRLGVVAREVTLLPRHWEWLAMQPGGASAALRRLVDAARHANAEQDAARLARERAYRFMSALAGNFVGFEEATRALFAGDRGRLAEQTAHWPADVRDHAIRLAFGAGAEAPAGAAASATPPPSHTAPATPEAPMTTRHDALKACKQTLVPAGVFAIRNQRTGRVLVGGSMNLAGALNRNRFELERGTHRNKALLADWKEFGAQDFSFTELDTVKPRDDPAFDHAAELEAMLELWREEHRRLGTESY